MLPYREAMHRTAVRTLTNSDAEGVVVFTIDYMDLVGNQGVQGTETTDFTGITYDRTAPTLPSVVIESDNFYDVSLAKVDDEISINFTTSEIIQTPTVIIGGDSATISGSNSSWLAVRDMTSTDDEGSLLFTIDFLDPAGNAEVRLSQLLMVVELLLIEPRLRCPPAISSNNNNYVTLAKVFDSVNITIIASESIQEPVVSIGGMAALISGSASSWGAIREMISGDPDGSIGFTVDYMDMAGNDGTQSTQTSDNSDVVFDKTPPTLSVSIVSDNLTTYLANLVT